MATFLALAFSITLLACGAGAVRSSSSGKLIAVPGTERLHSCKLCESSGVELCKVEPRGTCPPGMLVFVPPIHVESMEWHQVPKTHITAAGKQAVLRAEALAPLAEIDKLVHAEDEEIEDQCHLWLACEDKVPPAPELEELPQNLPTEDVDEQDGVEASDKPGVDTLPKQAPSTGADNEVSENTPNVSSAEFPDEAAASAAAATAQDLRPAYAWAWIGSSCRGGNFFDRYRGTCGDLRLRCYSLEDQSSHADSNRHGICLVPHESRCIQSVLGDEASGGCRAKTVCRTFTYIEQTPLEAFFPQLNSNRVTSSFCVDPDSAADGRLAFLPINKALGVRRVAFSWL